MAAIGVHLNKIHIDILNKNLEKLKEDLPLTHCLEFGEEYICWTPIEHAKLNLKHAKMFNSELTKQCEKIYHVVRDYTLFHAISDGDLEMVKKIIIDYSEELDLDIRLNVEHLNISLFSLGKRRKEVPAINSSAIYTLLANFHSPTEGI